jgi:Flp pilus assembly secretin CpaC
MIMFKYSKVIAAAAAFILACLSSGCNTGDLFSGKAAELQAEKILAEANRIEPDEDTKNPVPRLYTQEPEVIQHDKEFKIFYFTKNQPPATLSKILAEQKLGAKIAVIAETNQLLITCGSEKEASEIIDFLKKADVSPLQVKINCMILEHYADVTMDWETKIEIENFLGEEVTFEGLFPGASLRAPQRGGFGLDIGYISNAGVAGHEVSVLVDMLVSRGYMKILMNPEVKTVNGKEAFIRSTDKVPVPRVVNQRNLNPYTVTAYEDVEDILKVTPTAYSDGTVGIKAEITLGAKSTPEGATQLPIRTKRVFKTEESRLKSGNSLIIGGFKKTEKLSVIRGVPFFKDIPLIGILFSSKDFEERVKEVIFIVTPSIVAKGIDHQEMIDYIRNKHADPDMNRPFNELLTDPLGTFDYYKMLEKKAAEEEISRIRAEIQVNATEREIALAELKLIELRDSLESLEKLTDEERAQYTKTQAQLNKEIEEKKALLTSQQAELEAAKAAKAEVQKQMEAEKQRNQQLVTQLQKLEEVKTQIEEQKQQTENLKVLSDNEKQTADSLNSQLETLKARLKELRDEYSRIKAEHESSSQAEEQISTESQPEPEAQEDTAETQPPEPQPEPETQEEAPQQESASQQTSS